MKLVLSGGDVVNVEHEGQRLRIISSSYGWMQPGPEAAYYLEPSVRAGGYPYFRVCRLGDDGTPNLDTLGDLMKAGRRIMMIH